MPGTRGELFGAAIVALLIEITWVTALSALMFLGLKLAGIFRVSEADENMGLDTSKHGGAAYRQDDSSNYTAADKLGA